MIIRQYSDKDIPRLIQMRFDFTAESKEIDHELYEPFYKECLEFFNDMNKSERWKIWVAEVDGVIVSHIYLEIIDTVPRPGRVKSPWGYITNVYTVPSNRSKGIGGEIMEEVKSWASENGVTFIMVWPSELSTDFYSRYGFKKAEEIMENHLK